MIKYVYIHYPFCLKKCGYCSFFSIPYDENIASEYVDILLREIENYHRVYEIKPVTIYLGGGTPSILSVANIERILAAFDLSNLVECTLEVNPATIDAVKAKELNRLRINRLSIGVQSFVDEELDLLGRIHNNNQTNITIDLLRDNGFKNISLDIMYGLPEGNLENLTDNLNQIKRLNPNHISTYCLSLASDSPMALSGVHLPEDEISADQYRYLREELIKMGYEQYEISNFTQKGFESLHNLGYWKMEEYIGLGAGAHGFVANTRYNNPESLASYQEVVSEARMLPNGVKQTEKDLRNDFLIQGFRLTEGIDTDSYRTGFNDDFFVRYEKPLQKYAPYIDLGTRFVKLLPESYFVSNEIIAGFLE